MNNNRRQRLPILLSMAAAVITFGLKYLAYYLTDSVGLLSDAAESLVNLLAAFTAYFCLWFASLPVDATHTYGHEKIEFFSSGLEGLLIIVAAMGIVWCGVLRLISPAPLQTLDLGMSLSLVASLINLIVAQVLLRVGASTQSIVLEADGRHLMTDVWTSAGVLAGLVLVWLTGWVILDPIVALLVAANICWTGSDLIWRSFQGLLDHALPQQEQDMVRKAINDQLEEGMTFHALRTRRAGSKRFADFHLLVPGSLSVTEAHAVGVRIEQSVEAVLPGIEVTIHVEPVEEPECWKDSDLLEVERRQSNK